LRRASSSTIALPSAVLSASVHAETDRKASSIALVMMMGHRERAVG
jgi:hypothetical protein